MIEKKELKLIIFLILISIPFNNILCDNANQKSILNKLEALIPEAEFKSIKPLSPFKEVFEIKIPQPLNHNRPCGEKFFQKIFLSHVDFLKPVVLVTEGYSRKNNYVSELSSLLKANQIIVEHRYFGDSKPNSLRWEYLNIKQASDDYHQIVNLFKKLYKGKWISTGRSKGGQTALFYRRFYPDDVDATVAYVAPLNLASEDPRIDNFIKNLGDENCIKKIKDYQITLLKNREKIIPLLKEYSRKKNYEYPYEIEIIFEYAVLEYPFTFWQWGDGNCDSIPACSAPKEEIFEHFVKIIPFNSYYSKKALESLKPAFYQFFTELGYYGYRYNSKSVLRLLKVVQEPTNLFFAPKNTEIKFNPEVMKDIINWLQNNGNNIIYIYGELDPWSASAINLKGKTNAIKIVKKGGNHRVRIRDLCDEEKKIIFSALKKWLNIKISNFT